MEFLWTLYEIRTPFLDQLFQVITWLGQELVPIAFLCVLYWCFDKKLALQIGFTYVSAGLMVQGLKVIFRIPRPWILDPDFKAVESAVPAATGYSFPSGHTQSGTSLFAPLALHARKWYLKGVCIAAFLLIGFSRMYLGCHTPKDVLTAMGISLLCAWLFCRYQRIFTEYTPYTGWISLICALAAVLVCCYSFCLFHNGVIEKRYASDCFKISGAVLGFALGWYLEQRYLQFSPECKGKLHIIVRILTGLIVTAGIQYGLKPLIGGTLIGKLIQHALVILWVIYLYPLLFTRKVHHIFHKI